MTHTRQAEKKGTAGKTDTRRPPVQAERALNSTPRVTAEAERHAALFGPALQRRPIPGMPKALQTGVEALSGVSLEGVRVHNHSNEPASIGALAYARDPDIHLGPGAERHLPHEAWHIVQQRQGRVSATGRVAGQAVNDSPALEAEASRMGAAAQMAHLSGPDIPHRQIAAGVHATVQLRKYSSQPPSAPAVIQRRVGFEFETPWLLKAPGNVLGPDTPVIKGAGWDIVPDHPSTVAALPHDLKPSVRVERNWLGGETRTTVLPKYQGYGHMEFVTGAFEENAGGRVGLQNSVNGLIAFIKALQRGTGSERPLNRLVTATANVNWVQHVQTMDAEVKDRIVVDNTPAFFTTPQMTGGIKLSRLPQLLRVLGTNSRMARYLGRQQAPLAQQSHARFYGAALQRTDNWLAHHPLPVDWSPEQKASFQGAVAHLVSIVFRGHVAGSVPKTKYLSTLLSRTDFGKYPEDLRQRFPAAVLEISGAEAGNRLFRTAQDQTPPTKITVGEWLAGVAAGRDPLDWGQDRRNDEKSARWEPQQVGSDGDRAIGHVYEFRGAGPPALHDPDQLLDYALGLFELVQYVNSSAHGVFDPADLDAQPHISQLPGY